MAQKRRAPLIINACLSGGAVLVMSFALAESIVNLLPDSRPASPRSYEEIADQLFPASSHSR